MKIYITSCLAGQNFTLKPGDIVEWDDKDAKRMVANGVARPLTDVEAAAHGASQKAANGTKSKETATKPTATERAVDPTKS